MQNNNQFMVLACVACVHHNIKNKNGFPLVCPKLQLPCMAIEPQYILEDDKSKILMQSLNKTNRVNGKFIDSAFIQNMQNGYEEILSKGIDFSQSKSY